jgi:long-subunit fatty acid transport protein
MKLKLTLLLALTALLSGTASAQTNVGTTLAQFLKIEPSARLAGAGNAGAGAADGIETVHFNTAAIGLLEGRQVMATHSFWFEDISYDHVAVSLPAGEGNVLFSFTSLNSGEIDVRTVSQPLGTGERYTVGDVAVGVGYGRRLSESFAAGFRVNFINERIWHTTATLLTFDTGGHYRLNDRGAAFGFCLSNIGTRGQYTGRDLAIQYDADSDIHGDNSSLPAYYQTDRFPVPILFRIGLVYPLSLGEWSTLTLLADALHPNDNSESVNLGAEWTWRDGLSLRVGYQTLFRTESQQGLTWGFGAATEVGGHPIRLDYAWADHDYLSDTHRIGIVLGFGGGSTEGVTP